MTKHELIAHMWDSDLSPHSKLIFLAILDFRNRKDGMCFPSMDTISTKVGMCRNTVASCIKEIQDEGFFVVKKVRPRGAKFSVNSYVFNFQCSPDEQSNEQSNEQTLDKSVEQSNERAQFEHKPIEPIEPIKEKCKKEKIDPECQKMFDELWDAWEPFEMVKGSKQKALQSFLKLNGKEDPEKIIRSAKRYCAECERLKIKTKHLVTWINQEGWNDEQDKPKVSYASIDEWKRRIFSWSETGDWNTHWGPAPYENGNVVPKELLDYYG